MTDKKRHPTPQAVRQARGQLTQTQAGALVQTNTRNWQHWEAGDRKMHPGLWELFLIKTGAENKLGSTL
jgi:hypothetical protein